MPRPRRLHIEGALYYVTLRSGSGTRLFQDTQDVRTYLQLLQEYKAHYGFSLFAFTLTAEQIHLCLEVQGDATISAIMHALNSRYTKYHGKRHDRAGHLFQGRYRCTLAEKDPYLLRLTRYVHAVPDPFSNSLAWYQGMAIQGSQDLVEAAEVMSRLPGNPQQAYAQFLNAAPAEEFEQLAESLRKPVIGSPAFVAHVAGLNPEVPTAAAPTVAQEPVPVLVRRRGTARRFLMVMVSAGTVAGTVAGTLGLRHQPPAAGIAAVAPKPSAAMPALPAPRTAASALMLATLNVPAIPDLWEIQIKPTHAPGKTGVQPDTLRFAGGSVSSSRLAEQGFPASNYTLTQQPDGTSVWETIQTHPNGGTVLWRGEWDGHRMQGRLSRHPAGGEAQDFVFVGMSAQPAKEERTL